MKLKIIILALICLLPALIPGQTPDKGKIGISYSIGGATSFADRTEGAPDFEFSNATSFGLNYLAPKNNLIAWETGVNYSLYNIKTLPADGVDREISNSTMTLIDIPLGVRADFADFFFVNGGMLIGFEMTNNSTFHSQSGFGVYGGAGGNYDFKFGGSIFINPFVKIYSLLPFAEWKNHSKLLEYGVRIGVLYKI
ncbi:MAG: hypothetical protein GX102_12605 [Porphyromonadaceae bacterium]|nr:hypothetical protein [Porphyromonadaceae bacterium]